MFSSGLDKFFSVTMLIRVDLVSLSLEAFEVVNR